MLRRIRVTAYLLRVLRKERPSQNTMQFIAKTAYITTDELCRIADAIERFGLDNLI